jgi:hypothetical protein
LESKPRVFMIPEMQVLLANELAQNELLARGPFRGTIA